MADNTNVLLNMASRSVTQTGELYAALVLLTDINKHAVDAGYVFDVAFDDVLAEVDSLQHLDNTTLNQFLGFVVPGVVNFLDTEATGGKTYSQWIALMRSGGSQ